MVGSFGRGIGRSNYFAESDSSYNDLDVNTVLLWRFDETENYSVHPETDEMGVLDLVSPNTFNGGCIVFDDGIGGLCKGYFTSSRYLYSTTNAALTTLLSSEGPDGYHTIEAWVYVDLVGTTINDIFGFGGVGETLATNYLNKWELYRGSTSGPTLISRYFWEYGAGTNVTVNSTAVVNAGEWTHIAFTSYIEGGTKYISTYINGAFVDTVSGTAPAGGTTAFVTIGGAGTTYLAGSMCEVKISNVLRSAGEILADASIPTRRHTTDANTVHLWRLRKRPALRDYSGNGLHLGEYTSFPPSIAGPITGTYGRYHNQIPGQCFLRYRRDVATDAVIAMLTSSSYTLEVWFKTTSNVDCTMMTMFIDGETTATNFLIYGKYLGATNKLQMFWEYSGGVNVIIQSDDLATISKEGDDGNWHLAAFIIEVTGATRTVSFFCDGIPVGSTAGVTAATGGTSTVITLNHPGSTMVANGYIGTVSVTRLSDIIRTPAEILANYNRKL